MTQSSFTPPLSAEAVKETSSMGRLVTVVYTRTLSMRKLPPVELEEYPYIRISIGSLLKLGSPVFIILVTQPVPVSLATAKVENVTKSSVLILTSYIVGPELLLCICQLIKASWTFVNGAGVRVKVKKSLIFAKAKAVQLSAHLALLGLALKPAANPFIGNPPHTKELEPRPGPRVKSLAAAIIVVLREDQEALPSP